MAIDWSRLSAKNTLSIIVNTWFLVVTINWQFKAISLRSHHLYITSVWCWWRQLTWDIAVVVWTQGPDQHRCGSSRPVDVSARFRAEGCTLCASGYVQDGKCKKVLFCWDLLTSLSSSAAYSLLRNFSVTAGTTARVCGGKKRANQSRGEHRQAAHWLRGWACVPGDIKRYSFRVGYVWGVVYV